MKNVNFHMKGNKNSPGKKNNKIVANNQSRKKKFKTVIQC